MRGRRTYRRLRPARRRDLPRTARRRTPPAEPFPHVVLDDVLDARGVRPRPSASSRACATRGWHDYLPRQRAQVRQHRPRDVGPDPARRSPGRSRRPRFVEFLERAHRHRRSARRLDSMDGGGLHRTLPGGHLNVHADFTAHHVPRGLAPAGQPPALPQRREWEPAWGGELELWARDMARCVATHRTRRQPDAALHHRRVVASTAIRSRCGALPAWPASRSRSTTSPGSTTSSVRPTNYRPRPGTVPERRSCASIAGRSAATTRSSGDSACRTKTLRRLRFGRRSRRLRAPLDED